MGGPVYDTRGKIRWVDIHKPSPTDLPYFVKNLRAEDVTEHGLLFQEPIIEQLRDSLREPGAETYGIFVDCRLEVMFGTSRNDEGDYAVWMMATKQLELLAPWFLQACKVWFPYLTRHPGNYYNLTWEGHTKTRAWLRWLGFKLQRLETPVYDSENNPQHFYLLTYDHV